MSAGIEVRKPTEDELKRLGARSWPIWTCGVVTFDWTYDDRETCLILEGKVRVEPTDGRPAAEFGPGDLVVFPKGLPCVWKVSAPVRKHYRFG